MSHARKPDHLRIHGEMTVRLPDEGEYGPVMRALPTDRMRAFVIALHEQALSGDSSQMRAAQAAGYGGSKESLEVIGHRLAHDDRIQAAMLEEGGRRLGALIPISTLSLSQIIRDGKPAQRLKAIGMVLDRAGLPARTEHKVTVHREQNESEKIATAIELARFLGIDATALLGTAGVEAGADIVEVTDFIDITEYVPEDEVF